MTDIIIIKQASIFYLVSKFDGEQIRKEKIEDQSWTKQSVVHAMKTYSNEQNCLTRKYIV